MSKKMLINAILPEENRVAIVENGLLCELDIEVASREQTKGNIYKAVVVRVETGLQAAFVDYGAERMGFLQIDEINFKTVRPDYNAAEGRGRPRITDLLHRGQELLVQIVKEERGTKGAALTTYLSLAGRYMVLMPDSTTRGVSRKAENDAQRKQLKKAMTSLELPDNVGYIVRTAALDQTREELERDSRYLLRLYENIRQLSSKAKAPSLIYKESNLVIRSIRDYFTTDMDEVLIDDPDMYREAREFFQMVMPDLAGLVKQHHEQRPIFSRYQIEDQIETISSNKVNLPSGGSIVIDSTEALVAIDINSGKMSSEQSVEDTATKTNMEAAAEIGRQLRLRDLGGLIVIDFIDMYDRKNVRAVEQQLKKSTALDKARINIGRISQFGLLEMSRQRIRATLASGTFRTCPHCHGLGRIKSPEAMAVSLLRRLHTGVAKGQIGKVDAQMPLDVASYLLNNKREELFELERRYRLQIHIHGRPGYLTDQLEIDFQKRAKEPESSTDQVTAGSMLQSLAEMTLSELEQEKPAERLPVSESEPDPAPETAEAESGPPPKKRRRRGGRKKTGAATAAAESAPAQPEDETSTPDSAEATRTHPAAEAAPESSADPATEPVVTATADDSHQTTAGSAEAEPSAPQGAVPTKKPRRRRSGRGRARKPAATDAADTAIADQEPLSAASTLTPSTSASIEPPAIAATLPDAPKPFPGDAASKENRDATSESQPAVNAGNPDPADQASEGSAGTGILTAKVTPDAQPRRTRKKTASPTKPDAGGTTETAQPAAVAPGTGDKPATAPPKPRRTAAKRTPKAAAGTTQPEAGDTATTAQPAAVVPKTAEKPATAQPKPRRTAAKRTPKAAAGTTQPEAGDTATTAQPATVVPKTADKPATAQPKPRRTAAKRTSKAAAGTNQPEAGDTKATTSNSRPAKKSNPAKPAATEQTSDPGAPRSTAQDEADAPRPRRSSARRKTVAATPDNPPKT